MSSIAYAKLPADVQARAYDAAIAETSEYTQRFGQVRPDCNVDRSSPDAATAFITLAGGIPAQGGTFQVSKDAFAKSMSALKTYMTANNIDTIEMPAVRDIFVLQPAGSLIFAAIDAALGNSFLR